MTRDVHAHVHFNISGAGVVVGGSGCGSRSGFSRRGSVGDESGRSLGHVRLAVVPGVAAVVLVAAVGGGRAVEAGHAAVEAALVGSSVDHGLAPGGGGRGGDLTRIPLSFVSLNVKNIQTSLQALGRQDGGSIQ